MATHWRDRCDSPRRHVVLKTSSLVAIRLATTYTTAESTDQSKWVKQFVCAVTSEHHAEVFPALLQSTHMKRPAASTVVDNRLTTLGETQVDAYMRQLIYGEISSQSHRNKAFKEKLKMVAPGHA